MKKPPDTYFKNRNQAIKQFYVDKRKEKLHQYEILNILADTYKPLKIDSIAAIISKTKLEK